MPSSERYAYVTVITNERYILGLKALAISLRRVNTQYPLVVLIPRERYSEIRKKILSCDFLSTWDTEERVFKVVFKSKPLLKIDQFEINNSTHKHWNETFFKLSSTLLTEYEKIILIDSDMMVLKNLDHLFERDAFSAANPGNAKWNGFNQLNSGLIVIKPSETLYDELIKLIPKAKKTRDQLGFDVGDQDVIREYVPSWPIDTHLHLDESYNLYIHHAKYYIRKTHNKDIFVLHFVGPVKPFNAGRGRLLKILLTANCFFMFWSYLKYISLYSFKVKKIAFEG